MKDTDFALAARGRCNLFEKRHDLANYPISVRWSVKPVAYGISRKATEYCAGRRILERLWQLTPGRAAYLQHAGPFRLVQLRTNHSNTSTVVVLPLSISNET